MKPRSTKHRCPKCGSQSMLVQPMQDGSVEMVCLELECDFTEVVAGQSLSTAQDTAKLDESFASRLPGLTTEQLDDMAENLARSMENLSGRARRIATQQLAIVNAERKRRTNGPVPAEAAPRGVASLYETAPTTNPGVPPQFSTPEARAKRIEGIRAYHRRKKGSTVETGAVCDLNASLWLRTLTKTLQQELEMHEQAAKDYARLPQLFPLHIDHSARAFELRRIIDLLDRCFELL